jgi:hypothetical protein
MVKIKVKTGSLAFRVNNKRLIYSKGDVFEVSPEMVKRFCPQAIEVLPEAPAPMLEAVKVEAKPLAKTSKKGKAVTVQKPVQEEPKPEQPTDIIPELILEQPILE